MSEQDKRRSERVVPFVSDEEVVVIRTQSEESVLAKIMDLSETGTLLYLLAEGDLPDTGDSPCTLSPVSQGKVFDTPAAVARKSGRLIAFNFVAPLPEAMHEIQAKLIRMEIEWMRLSRRE